MRALLTNFDYDLVKGQVSPSMDQDAIWHSEEISTPSVEGGLECLPHVIHAPRGKYEEASFASIYDSFFVARGTLGALYGNHYHHLKRGCVTVYARGGSVASTPSIARMHACLRVDRPH